MLLSYLSHPASLFSFQIFTMFGIGAKTFYSKQSDLVTIVPTNNWDSEGSSSSDEGDNDCGTVPNNKKKKQRVNEVLQTVTDEEIFQHQPVEPEENDSDVSEIRWNCGNVKSDLVIPESDHSDADVLSTISSTAISPISEMSSPNGSVFTLPPSPSMTEELKKSQIPKPLKKKKVTGVTICDRYAQTTRSSQRVAQKEVRPAISNVQTRRCLYPVPVKNQNSGHSVRSKRLLSAVSKNQSRPLDNLDPNSKDTRQDCRKQPIMTKSKYDNSTDKENKGIYSIFQPNYF